MNKKINEEDIKKLCIELHNLSNIEETLMLLKKYKHTPLFSIVQEYFNGIINTMLINTMLKVSELLEVKE